MNKFSAGVVCLALLGMPACTTVQIAKQQASEQISTTASVTREALQRSVTTLLHVFSKEKWSADSSRSQNQTAANILLEGFKDDAPAESNTDAYIRSIGSSKDVTADIIKAQQHVETITSQARTLLAETSPSAKIKSDLNALEKALISSRQAETTFMKALKAQSFDLSGESGRYLEAYIASVEDLKATTDAFGGMMRGDLEDSISG